MSAKTTAQQRHGPSRRPGRARAGVTMSRARRGGSLSGAGHRLNLQEPPTSGANGQSASDHHRPLASMRLLLDVQYERLDKQVHPDYDRPHAQDHRTCGGRAPNQRVDRRVNSHEQSEGGQQ